MLFDFLLLFIQGMLSVTYALLRRFIQRPLGIHDLPLELLSEIASHLDFVDVISLRQTTQQLQKATEARVVWYSLAKKYAARHFNIPRPENGTIDTLKTNELREWIRPRLVVDQIWRKETATPISRRSIDLQEETRCLNFIPSGRWLLAFRETGFIDYYDLDSKEPNPQLLSEPDPGDSSDLGPVIVASSLNKEAPILEFTLVVSSIGSKFYEIPRSGWLHIRKVGLVGEGPSASLQAHKSISIPHIRHDSYVCAVGLSGNLVARNIVEKWKVWIEVFRWTECSSHQLMTSSIRIERGMQGRLDNGIHFIGEDRVLCITRSRILLYKIPVLVPLPMDWDPAVGYCTEQDVAKPNWAYSQTTISVTTPPSISFDGTSYRLVIQVSRTVVGIYIPPSLDEQPSIRFRVPLDFPILLSLYKGCILYEGGTAARVGYGWEPDSSETFFINGPDRRTKVIPRTLFDAETGRCLIMGKYLEKVQVVDFLS